MPRSKKFASVTIRPRHPPQDRLLVGANTELLLDGKPFPGVSKVTLEVEAAGVAKCVVEFYPGDVHVLGKYQIVKKKHQRR